VFGNLGYGGRQPRAEDVELSGMVQKYWVNFARSGDPNGEGLPEWPTFISANERVMVLDATPRVGPTPNPEQLKALDAYFAWRREQASKKPSSSSRVSSFGPHRPMEHKGSISDRRPFAAESMRLAQRTISD